ncbi:hypothetical protein J6590_002531 [Homalodisca vitripennis]|nr:hypothetical protein J6590_002531 [Homalodisca vitripennis]
MFWFPWILFLVSLVRLEGTRVSRIKQNFYNQRPEENVWLTTPSSNVWGPQTNLNIPTESYASTVEVTTKQPVIARQPVTAKQPVTTIPTTLNPRMICHRPYSCINCTTYRLCIPTNRGFVEFTSGSCPAERPYCDNYSGTCVNSVAVAVKCASPDRTFRCMQDGHFPHPSNPSRYFICSDLKAYGYSCKEGYKYYAPSQGCSKFSWIAEPFDCSNLNATKVVYSSGGSFFAYCVNGQPHLINTCGENEFFNVTSQVCEVQCTRELIAPDNNSCLKYFKCQMNPTTQLFERLSLSCPPGEGFSIVLKKCVSLNHLVSCKEN